MAHVIDCDCHKKINEQLPDGVKLSLAIFPGGGQAYKIKTYKVASPRKKSPAIHPVYCPFCGEKMPKKDS